MRIQFLVLLTFLAPRVASAIERYEYYNGIRQMGMGGAAVATVNDETALFLNPAGLSKLRDPIITLFDPELEGNTELSSISSGTNIPSLLDPQVMLDRLKTMPEKHLHARAQVSPSFVFPDFGLGVLARYSWDAEVDPTGTTMRLDHFNDYAVALGYSVKLFDGRIKIGVTGRYMDRIEIQQNISTASTALTMTDLVSEGTAIAGDVGLIITAPWTWLPTISGVLRNVGDTTFNMGNGFVFRPAGPGRTPQPIPQTLDVAIGLFPIHGKKIRSTITAEYRDVLNKIIEEPADPSKKIHVGLELNLGDTLFLRGGMNQRYWTAGLEFAMPFFQMQFASYGEEIGTATTNKEDRRYMMKVSLRF